MDFNFFKTTISKLENLPVGGLEAQFKLAPKLRLNYSQNKIKALNPKKAAVTALFYPNKNNETCFLLTLRASYNGTHSSQISFPGGKYDKKDNNLESTALRETFEEVGIHPHKITIFKQMTDVFIPPSNFLVTPFLGYLKRTPLFTKNHEVEKLISVTIKDLLEDSSISTTTLSTSYATNIEVPCFVLNSYVVWGATAMMLSEIKQLIKNI
ncbi:NUDIX hydrolase [Lutibacter sp.]